MNERDPICESSIQDLKTRDVLDEAVESCIEAATFERDITLQLSLVKSAAYGARFMLDADDQHDILEDLNAARSQIGFVSDNTQLYHRLTVRENLTFFAKLYKMQNNDIINRINELSQSMQFIDFLDKKINDCSTGMQQKANIARALIHSPQLLILDEPTSGLDIKAAQTALNIIKDQKNENTLVIFSTHHLHEVATLADHIIAIEQGQCVFSGTPTQFTEHFQADTLYQAALNCTNNQVMN